MHQDQKDFESKYHFKVVKPRGEVYKNLPIKEYIVTTALLNWEDNEDTTIFAIKALDYTLENKHWITIHIKKDELEKCMADFDIIEDGYDKYVKPKMIEESLVTYMGEDGDDWLVYFSKYYINGEFIQEKPKTEYFRIKKSQVKDKFIGLNDYLFMYRTVYDLGQPSMYIFPIPPTLSYVQDIIAYVEPVRQRILDNKIVNGIDLENIKR